MAARVRVILVSHPGNGYWRLVRHLLAAHEDAALIGEAACAADALVRLTALLEPPDLLLASPRVPSGQEETNPAAFVRALAVACPPTQIALFGHSYDAWLDGLRWELGVPSYLCWDELMAGETLSAPRKLGAVLTALLAGAPGERTPRQRRRRLPR